MLSDKSLIKKFIKLIFFQKEITLFICCIIVSHPSLSDEYHYKNTIVGDRASGLAGAFTAISNSVSSLYYNPAGIANTNKNKISGSVSAYNYKVTEYKNIDFSNNTLKQFSKSLVSNYLGIVQPLDNNNGTVGFSIVVPNAETSSQNDSLYNIENDDGTGSTYDNLTDFNDEDRTTLVGFSYASSLNDTIDIGITIYAYLKNRELTTWQYSLDRDDNLKQTIEESYYTKTKNESIGLQPRLGILWSPNSNWSLGLMVQGTSVFIKNNKKRFYGRAAVCKDDKTCKYHLVSREGFDQFDANLTSDSRYKAAFEKIKDYSELPIETNLGIVYSTLKKSLYSVDLNYYSSTPQAEETWNIALGTEQFITNHWLVSSGIYSNNSNTPNVKEKGMKDHIDIYGVTLAISKRLNDLDITLGINVYKGSGYADNGVTRSAQRVNVDGSSLFISTSSSF